MKILLDIDGVLANFVQGCRQFHGKDIPEPSDFNIAKSFGMDSNSFWKPIKKSYQFWEALPLRPEGRHLISLINDMNLLKNTYLLSNPVGSRGLAGRHDWIKRHYPYFLNTNKFLLGPAKGLCNDGFNIIIDDYGKNCDKFVNSILWPQNWNDNRDVEDKVGYAKALLENWVENTHWRCGCGEIKEIITPICTTCLEVADDCPDAPAAEVIEWMS